MMSSFWDNFPSNLTKFSGSRCLVSSSRFIQYDVCEKLSKQSSSLPLKIVLDALFDALTPKLFFQRIIEQCPIGKTPDSDLNHLLLSFKYLSTNLCIINNSDELSAFSHYPGCTRVLEKINDILSHSQGDVFLMFPSSGLIPVEFNLKKIEVPFWDISHAENELKKRGLFPNFKSFEHLFMRSSGNPDFLLPLARNLNYSPMNLDNLITKAFQDPFSEISIICQAKWQYYLNNSKGYSVLKALLRAIALNPGCRLSELAHSISNTPAAVKDYLNSLMSSGAIYREKWYYYLSDSFFSEWIKSVYLQSKVDIESSSDNPVRRYQRRPIRKSDQFLEFD